MDKPLVFCRASVDPGNGKTIDTWELIPVGPSPVLHAVWDRNLQKLAVQFDSVKESVVPFMKQGGSKAKPKPEIGERREERYYITRISDHDAVEAILKNFVANYKDQEWKLEPIPEEEVPGPEPVDSEPSVIQNV